MRPEIIYVIVLILSALVSGGIALYGWQRRQMPAVTAFVLMMVGVTIWLLGYAFELYGDELPVMVGWIKVEYLGVATVPTLWLVFTIQYTGKERWLTRRNLIGLFVVPTIILILVWTNEWHHWYYPEYWVDTDGSFTMFAMKRGLTYWGGVVYAYLALLVATALLVQAFIRTASTYRRQIAVILASAAFPWLANFLYLTKLNPFPYLNITPLSFAMTGLVIAWGLFRYRLLDVIPIARDKVVESMRDGVIVLDAHARIVDLNPVAQAIVDAPLADIIAQPAEQVFSGQLSVLLHHLDTPGKRSQIVLGNPPTQRYYDILVSPLYNRQNTLNGWIALLHDTTERQEAELALQERTQELETRNAELSAFAHTVAHDLKSPLSVIMGFARLMEAQIETISPTLFAENLRRIASTGSKMTAIIDELLLLASVREMQEVNIAPLEMATIVSETLDRLRKEIAEAHAEVSVSQTWPAAVGYAPWVEEIWANYISNALKYGGKPEQNIPPRLELGAAPLDAQTPPSHVTFWVCDNGPGLTKAECAQLFTPFTRLHEVRAQGYGLGLSIARRIIERLGGEVGVISEPGQGSTFYFTLPRQGNNDG
ncbi:MAG: PAS domain-containing protein [Anaerolineae bacterium]|nr:PAS domain-containing protein [Anaerolineae bacterium]